MTDEMIDQIEATLRGEKPTEQKKADREHALMMLGYNQALLDHAVFPIVGAGTELFRTTVECVVNRLREKLEMTDDR